MWVGRCGCERELCGRGSGREKEGDEAKRREGDEEWFGIDDGYLGERL